MKVRSSLSPEHTPAAAAAGRTSLPLPKDVLEKVARALDEPARQQLALVGRACRVAVRQSRRGTALPTRLELFDCSRRRLNYQRVLDTFAPVQGSAPWEDTPLHRHYQRGAALRAAEKVGGITADISFDGGRYVGGVKERGPQGFGFWSNRAGDSYEGEWKDGKWHGWGAGSWSNGNRYEGEYEGGKLHGRGVYVWPDGNRYEGEFKDGVRHGRGTHVWPDGNRYEGEFRDDKRHGRGVYAWPDGKRYEGEFKDGVRHGRGVLVGADGSRREVMYKEGQLLDGEVPASQLQPTPQPKSVLSRLQQAFRRA